MVLKVLGKLGIKYSMWPEAKIEMVHLAPDF